MSKLAPNGIAIDEVEALLRNHEAAGVSRALALDLIARIRELEAALGYYTNATCVEDWGMQELAPDWEIARRALGLPEPDEAERCDILGIVVFPDEDTGEVQP